MNEFVRPVETVDKRKWLLTLSLAKPRQNTEAVFKAYELFIHGYILYIAN
jgi:hypothetical protein